MFGFQASDAQKKEKNCKLNFDQFYKENFAVIQPEPKRSFHPLKGNESHENNWKTLFNSGEPGSEGYGACFKSDPEDPCKKLL